MPMMKIFASFPPWDGRTCIYSRGAQPFWAKGRSVIFLVHSRAERQNY